MRRALRLHDQLLMNHFEAYTPIFTRMWIFREIEEDFFGRQVLPAPICNISGKYRRNLNYTKMLK